MRELRPGLWHWEAPHPQWVSGAPWGPEVSSYAIDDGERLLFFDPIAAPSELEALAGDRETAIVLTCPWHERDSRGLVERSEPRLHAAARHRRGPDAKWGLTAEQAGDGSPDVVWLLKEGIGEAHPYAAGERLDVGIEAFPGQKPNDTVLWVESHGAVIAGDTLVDFGNGLEINPRWLSEDLTREQVAAGLRPLLDLPVEHMLATHGAPFDRAALEHALT